MPCKDVAVVLCGCSEVLWCHINYLGNRWNVGKKEEQPALLWQSPGEKVISGVGGWGQEKRMSFDKRKKEEGVGALLLGGSFFVFVLCITRVNVFFTLNPPSS